MKKGYLVCAFLLGLFPASGLLLAKSAKDLKFKWLSLPSLYSYVTVLLRYGIVVHFFNMVWNWATVTMTFSVERYTVATGFFCMFCMGFVYQIISIRRTKKFIWLLQKLDEYDSLFPKSRCKRYCNCSPFLVYNIIFVCITITFPLLFLAALLFMKSSPREFSVQVFVQNIGWDLLGPALGVMTAGLFFLEAATIYPILQIAYFIKVIEQRFDEISKLIVAYSKPKSQYPDYNLLFDLYTTGIWTKNGLGQNDSGIITKSEVWSPSSKQFWKGMNQRYLEFVDVFTAFIQFSGIFLIVIFPVQIVSSVCTLYCTSVATILKDNITNNALSLMMILGLFKIWALSNVGHKIESTQGLILRYTFGVDTEAIHDCNERAEYTKFGHIVRSIPIRLNASGFFNVGRNNIPNVVTIMVSYIVCLLQFRGSEEGSAELRSSFITETGLQETTTESPKSEISL